MKTSNGTLMETRPYTEDTASERQTLEYAIEEIRKCRFITLARRAGFHAIIQDGIPTVVYNGKDFLYACDRLAKILMEDGWIGDYEVRQGIEHNQTNKNPFSESLKKNPQTS